MSSSTSPPPLPQSDLRNFEPVRPSPARPTSVLKHRAYLAAEGMKAESSTSAHKRNRAPVSSSPDPIGSSPSGHAQKRFREPTPIAEDEVELGAGIALVDAVAATGAETPVMDGEERVEDRAKSSEQDEPSVLFSEQLGTKTEPTEAVDDGEAFTVDEVPAIFSPTDFVDEEDEEPAGTDTAATAIQDDSSSPSSSSSHSDVDGDEHFQQWNERYARDDRLTSSDGMESLDEFIEPVWEEYEAYMPDEKAADHYRRFSRKIARQKKQKHSAWTASGEDRVLVTRKPRTTREVFEEQLMEGVEMKSYHSGDSEDFLMDHRPPLDRAGVKRDIKLFAQSMDVLGGDPGKKVEYQVIDRLGEGTFSSVYLAYDRRHGKYYNEWWTNKVDSTKRSSFQSHRHEVKLALKRILATSSPQRIENELDILEGLRGCRNVSQLVTAFREDDQVIIVLPYHQSDDFRHFYKLMDGNRMMRYMRALLRGLADIHARGIIHRDVKPANFLFDYEAGDGVLCDFGLAERYVPPRKPTCQHAPGTLEDLGGSRTKTTDTPAVEQAVYDARKRSRLGEGRIGFPQDDKRSAIKTNRAGTRGFRAPEVLLKCPDQTVSVDVWSAGIMLLSLLTHKFPVFNSSDDIEALMEIAAIFGRNAMEKCAMLHNRTIMTNVPTVDQSPQSLSDLVLRLNPHLYTPPLANPSPTQARAHIEAMDDALDLCSKLLKLDATKRVSAVDALNHLFFQGRGMHDDGQDREQEILSGVDGKCGHLHSVADGKHQAWFYKDCQEMQFGQGIPTATDKLCPEHEHWQQRTMLNPISTSRHFTNPDPNPDPDQSDQEQQPEPLDQEDQEDQEGEATPQPKKIKLELKAGEGDELEVMPPAVLSARDQNRAHGRPRQRVIAG